MLHWRQPDGVSDLEFYRNGKTPSKDPWRHYKHGHKTDIYVDHKSLKDILVKLVLSL